MARKSKKGGVSTLASTETSNTRPDSITIEGVTYLLTLPKDATPEIVSLVVKDTIEAASGSVDNLEVAEIKTNEISADEATIDTINITTEDGLKGDNLTVKNLYSSGTKDQVLVSDGTTTNKASWKTAKVTTTTTNTTVITPTISSSQSIPFTFSGSVNLSLVTSVSVGSEYYYLYVFGTNSYSLETTYTARCYSIVSNTSGVYMGGILVVSSSSRASGILWSSSSYNTSSAQSLTFSCYPISADSTTSLSRLTDADISYS